MEKYRYKTIADLLVIAHLLWIVILLGGVVFLVGHRWYIPYHIIIVSLTLLLNLVLDGCPLTIWEEKYRKAWDPSTPSLENSFLRVYIRKHLGVDFSRRQMDWITIILKIISYYVAIWFWVFPGK